MAGDKFDRKTIEAQLNELRTQAAEILKRLENAVDAEAEALRPKLKAAQDKLSELKQTSGEAWIELKPGLQRTWEELQKTLNQAASRFKSRFRQ